MDTTKASVSFSLAEPSVTYSLVQILATYLDSHSVFLHASTLDTSAPPSTAPGLTAGSSFDSKDSQTSALFALVTGLTTLPFEFST